MNASTQRLTLAGPAGALEALRDLPDPALYPSPLGVAIVAHPHPLFAGTMENKVVQTIARAFVQCGWTAMRFNFRGVGQSAGSYDQGHGEQADLLAVLEHSCTPGSPVGLAGFSFGSFVVSRALAAARTRNPIDKLLLVGTATSRFDVAPIPADLHDRTLVVHGEHDDTVPLASVMDWARPQTLAVTVVPAGSHFFHGQLGLLKSLVVRHITSHAV